MIKGWPMYEKNNHGILNETAEAAYYLKYPSISMFVCMTSRIVFLCLNIRHRVIPFLVV